MRKAACSLILRLLCGPLLCLPLCLPLEARADDPKPEPASPAAPQAPASQPKYPQDQTEMAPPQKPNKAKRTKAAKKKPRRKQAQAREIKGPIASFPAFQMLANGVSRVSVEISEKVEVTEHQAAGRLTYRLKGVSVPTRTNRLPLETMFFQSPVSRVQLVEQEEADLDLVIELSQPSTPTYKLVDTEGGVLLQVDFPALPKGQPKQMPEVPQPPKAKQKAAKAEAKP